MVVWSMFEEKICERFWVNVQTREIDYVHTHPVAYPDEF